jgi:hypothetical protein
MAADAIEAIEGPDLLVGGDAGIHRARDTGHWVRKG